MRFLDNVIDMNRYPIEEIDRATKLTRKIGLGVMGWHDALMQLGIPYDSEEALALAEEIAALHPGEGERGVARAGRERGVFPAFEGSRYDPDSPVPQRHPHDGRADGHDLDHRRLLVGIEPVFALAYHAPALPRRRRRRRS